MMHQRNVEGLRQNAQRKRQEAIERTKAGIRQLLKEGRAVNFKSVASVAGVSTAWLYKEPEIKAQIEQLREQQTKGKKSPPPKQRATEASKDAMIKTLKERIKKVEAENRGLRDHIEVVQGIAIQVTDLKKQIEVLKVEDAKLREQLDNRRNALAVERSKKAESNIMFLTDKKAGYPSTSKQLQSELDELGIRVNSTLEKKVKSAPQDVVFKAIESLKQAQVKGDVRNPSGFLVRAIEGQWTPNAKADTASKFPSGFLETYQRLCEAGVVDGGAPSDLPIWNNEIYVRVVNSSPKPWEAPYTQMRWKEAASVAGLAN